MTEPRIKLSIEGWIIFGLTIALAFLVGLTIGRGMLSRVVVQPEPPVVGGIEPAPPTDVGGGVACTLEAMACPDGSYVGRTGPNCEFSPCPGE